MTTTDSTSVMVPVDDGSDNYTVTISASNGCGAGPAISTGNKFTSFTLSHHNYLCLSVISNHARVTARVTPSSTVPVHGKHAAAVHNV